MTDTRSNVTQYLIDEVDALPLDAPPDEVRILARQSVLDWVGCTIAGASDPLTDILAEVFGAAGGGDVGLIGRGGYRGPWDAALLNGAAAHALDYDDTHEGMRGHPSTPVLSAAWSIVNSRGGTGQDLLAAYLDGVETETRLGLLHNPDHDALGWHPTATLGAFGAAAACARLLGLDAAGRRRALGIAACSSSGLKAAFGTMCKPLQVGRAAAAGVAAALLAEGGLTAPEDGLGAMHGFGETHSSVGPAVSLESVRGRFLATDTLFKFYASCFLTHAPIEAAIDIGSRLQGEPDIRSVIVDVHEDCLSNCGDPAPRTGRAAQFSITATVAMALLGDDLADPTTFAGARCTEPDVVAIRDRIAVRPRRNGPLTEATVTVTTPGGPVAATRDVGRPCQDLELQQERLERKFMALAAPKLGIDRASRTATLIAEFDTSSTLTALTSIVVPPVGSQREGGPS